MSKIEWTDATWNPIVGCSLVSPGCTNCYAMRTARRFDKTGSHYHGTTQMVNGKPVWTGKVNRAPERTLMAPLRWRKPRRIFVNSMSDLFHEDISYDLIDRIFTVMALTRRHQYQILTKRPGRMRDYVLRLARSIKPLEAIARDLGYTFTFQDLSMLPWPIPNIWLGTSVEDQKRADERIPYLLGTPAAVRFLSVEPLLGPVDLTSLPVSRWPGDPPGPPDASIVDALAGERWWLRHGARVGPDPVPALDWIIVGGESGPGARPMHPDWARSLRDQCVAAGVPFFFKQWGEWGPSLALGYAHSEWPGIRRCGKKAAGRTLDGRIWDEYPDEHRMPSRSIEREPPK